MRAVVLDLVKEAKAAGKTVIFSSHILSEVEEVCDRVVILRAGRLVHTQLMGELRQRHRIMALLKEPMPAIPDELQGQIAVVSNGDDQVVIEAGGELPSILHWLATLPLRDMRIEPLGLRTIYDRFHREDSTGGPALAPLAGPTLHSR